MPNHMQFVEVQNQASRSRPHAIRYIPSGATVPRTWTNLKDAEMISLLRLLQKWAVERSHA